MVSLRINVTEDLRGVLGRYLSRVTVNTILQKVFAEEGLDPNLLTRQQLERIYQNSLFSSLSYFCDPAKLTDIMLDLANLLEQIPDRSGSDRGRR